MAKEKPAENIRTLIERDVMMRLHELLPNRCLDSLPKEVIAFAIDDVVETSALGTGEDYYGDGDICLACERTILHYLGHPDY